MKQLIRSLLTFALVLVLLLGVVTPGLAADEAPPVIDARAAVMMDESLQRPEPLPEERIIAVPILRTAREKVDQMEKQ